MTETARRLDLSIGTINMHLSAAYFILAALQLHRELTTEFCPRNSSASNPLHS
jgi:hypothetical protein